MKINVNDPSFRANLGSKIHRAAKIISRASVSTVKTVGVAIGSLAVGILDGAVEGATGQPHDRLKKLSTRVLGEQE